MSVVDVVLFNVGWVVVIVGNDLLVMLKVYIFNVVGFYV